MSILIVLLIAGGSDVPRFTGSADRTRVYTREIEFDYPNWVWDAAWIKLEQAAIHAPHTFERAAGKEIVFDYLRTTVDLMQTEFRLEQVYADPEITDKEAASSLLRTQRDEFLARQEQLAPFKESILQTQLSDTLAGLGLTAIGQPLPPRALSQLAHAARSHCFKTRGDRPDRQHLRPADPDHRRPDQPRRPGGRLCSTSPPSSCRSAAWASTRPWSWKPPTCPGCSTPSPTNGHTTTSTCARWDSTTATAPNPNSAR
ncbi:MAG: hypothetical protein MZV63_06945 [Marinilabiliales bacterium]|nr:hypothetical protein [Marinilabiliales bacterium]